MPFDREMTDGSSEDDEHDEYLYHYGKQQQMQPGVGYASTAREMNSNMGVNTGVGNESGSDIPSDEEEDDEEEEQQMPSSLLRVSAQRRYSACRT